MKIIRDLFAFYDLTGCISGWRNIERLGIRIDFPDSAFNRKELPMLKEFCARNEEFHIISRIAPKVMVNHLDERAFIYHLENGSTDPSLCFYDDSPLDPQDWKTAEHVKLLLLS